MKNTISDLWNGNIAPCEHCGAHDVELNHLLGLMERNRENLRGGLCPEQAEVFQKYLDCAEAYFLRMLEIAFCDGFTLGSRLMVEALTERN